MAFKITVHLASGAQLETVLPDPECELDLDEAVKTVMEGISNPPRPHFTVIGDDIVAFTQVVSAVQVDEIATKES